MTLLFCDLVGSTELSHRLDAEDYQALASDYHHAVTQACAHFGGFVAKYLGDGVVVYFGYPQAHEDDAERAVRAALAILDEMRQLNDRRSASSDARMAVRVGIDTGMVVISQGAGAQPEVFGDAPNMAARLQSYAQPDTIVISGATLHLVRGLFDVEDLGELSLKGFSEPASAFRVANPRAVHDRRDLRPHARTPMVGRASELRLLTDGWERARRGAGGAALIRGDAGVGKSRVLWALRERIEGQRRQWIECHCTPYTQNSAFHSVILMLEREFGFGVEDGPGERIAKLESALRTAALDLPQAIPVFMALLSISEFGAYSPLKIAADLQRERTMDTLVRWATGSAEVRPMILAIEDAHWCDPSSLAVFAQVVAGARNANIFVVVVARPEFDQDWSRDTDIISLRLDRLGEAEAREAIGRLNRGRELPERVIRTIVARADGNPLYLEELVFALGESAALGETAKSSSGTEFSIPATLQDSLTARLDALGPERDLAQKAAVIGREFSPELLAASADLTLEALAAPLAQLLASGLVFGEGPAPHAVYAFKHALIHEAAYHAMLRRTRQQLHARVAHALETRFAKRAESQAEIIARHYEAAGMASAAMTFYQRAGEQAAAISACEEAVAQLRNALRLLGEVPNGLDRAERELALQLALGLPLVAIRGYPHPETHATYVRAVELCDANPATSMRDRAAALGGASICSTSLGDFESGTAYAKRLLDVTDEENEDTHLLIAHGQIAVPRFLTARYSEAVEHCDQVLALYDPVRHARYIAGVGSDHCCAAYLWSCWSLWILGRGDEAVRRGEAAIALARALDHPHSLAVALLWNAILRFWREDMDRVVSLADETIALSEAQGFLQWAGVARIFRGCARAALGGGKEACAEAKAGMTPIVRAHMGGSLPLYAALAETHLAVGDLAEARLAIAEGVRIATLTGQPFWDPEFHRLSGEVLLAEYGDRDLAEVKLREALDTASASGAAAFALRAAVSLARSRRDDGDPAGALHVLRPVVCCVTEALDTPAVRDALCLIEALEAATG